MKAYNKRLNNRKTSKVTIKRHKKGSHPGVRDDIKCDTSGVTGVRPEEIKFHQHS